MIASPSEYPGSSYRCNGIGMDTLLVQPHPTYLGLGRSEIELCAAYRALFDEAPRPSQLTEIRAYLQQQRALGGNRFQAMTEAELGHCVSVRPLIVLGFTRTHSDPVSLSHRLVRYQANDVTRSTHVRGTVVADDCMRSERIRSLMRSLARDGFCI